MTGKCILFVVILLLLLSAPMRAQTPAPSPEASPAADAGTKNKDKGDPVENSDDLKSKVTFGVYFTPGHQAYDLNLRHQFGQFTVWIAGYDAPNNNQLLRTGVEWEYKKAWFHFWPSVEVATTKAVSASLYSELGYKTIAIVGVARTNLKSFFDLYWDPSESVQLGLGHKISSYDRIQAYTIFDVRLHTGQQNTHVLWRHKLNRTNGITFDAVFKSGHDDAGKYIRAAGLGVYYDRPRWFWKLYYDPYVNFSDHGMVRTGIGLKF